jgi:hypothetical protein
VNSPPVRCGRGDWSSASAPARNRRQGTRGGLGTPAEKPARSVVGRNHSPYAAWNPCVSWERGGKAGQQDGDGGADRAVLIVIRWFGKGSRDRSLVGLGPAGAGTRPTARRLTMSASRCRNHPAVHPGQQGRNRFVRSRPRSPRLACLLDPERSVRRALLFLAVAGLAMSPARTHAAGARAPSPASQGDSRKYIVVFNTKSRVRTWLQMARDRRRPCSCTSIRSTGSRPGCLRRRPAWRGIARGYVRGGRGRTASA